MKRSPILSLFVAIAAALALSACSMFRDRSDYTHSAETRPLEVPPDLDSPAAGNELLVPAAGSGAGAAVASAAPVRRGPTEVHVDGNVQDTWQRVGSALQRSQIGSIGNRDEAGHSYAFDFDAEYEDSSQKRGFFGAVFHHLGFGEGEHVKQRVSINVVDDGGGSRVTIDAGGSDRSAQFAERRTASELTGSIPGATAIVPAAPAPVAVAAPVAAPPVAAPSAAPPAAVGSAPPAISGVSVGGSDLHVADTVDHTWQRVGLALERAQIGTLSARDPAAHTYSLDFSGTVETKPSGEHHWYSRILHPFGGGGGKTEQVTRTLTVRVSDDAGGARVSVEGDTSDKSTADAARRVVAVLRDRLS